MTTNKQAELDLVNIIIADADRCVRCGICMPYCPTYKLTQHEAESPRGRIALIKGLVEDKIPFTDRMAQHLDQCLDCRACEAVCPLGVRYGRLFDAGQGFIKENYRPNKRLPLYLDYALAHKLPSRLLRQFIRIAYWLKLIPLYQSGKLTKPAVFRRLINMLPETTAPLKLSKCYKALNTKLGEVSLFLGCVNQIIYDSAIKDSIKVLRLLGYDVYPLTNMHCCGALYLHSGKHKQAKHLMQTNINKYRQGSPRPIITLTTGCSALLQEYTNYTEVLKVKLEQHHAWQQFSDSIIDIHQFITETTWPKNLKIQDLASQVLLHIPCTMRNVLQQENAMIKLLNTIPKLKVKLLNYNSCCGAAGSYMLEHPTIAAELAKPILQECSRNKCHTLVTSNIGCMLHIKQQARLQRSKLSLIHPISLFARQITLKKQ